MKKIHILSNINIGKKITAVFMLFLISSALLFTGMVKNISDSEKKYKSENEKTILNSTEQYINASIENIISIAKTIYTNNSLYTFLNREYQNPAEYYEAFYNLDESNSLIITENQNIKKYTVYTDNSTIMSGGNIMKLSDVKSEAWYRKFIELNKSMIVYCDNKNQSFSLIRRLDYNTIDTGECYLKIDFNNAVIENYFKNIDFKGNLYVMSGGVLIFSNTGEKNIGDINITPDYQCYVKNYYTSELEYYALEKESSVSEIISENISYIIPFALLSGISLLISIFVTANIISRSRKFSRLLNSEDELSKLESSSGGSDEIGKMFSNCIELFDKLQFSKREYNKCSEALEKSYENSRQLLLQALHLDVKSICFSKYPIENPHIDFSVPVPINTEFQMLEKHFRNRKIKNYEILLNPMPEGISVLPFSTVMIADDLIQSPDKKISVSASADNECLRIMFKTNSVIASGKILKLRTLFENYPHQTDFDFKAGFIYNHYRRIKNYYGSNVSIDINSDNGFSLEIIFLI